MNLGLTCYINSTVQCLAHTYPLTKHFISHHERQSNAGEMTAAFSSLLVEMWNNKNCSVKPDTFKSVLERCSRRFQGCQQEDSEEMKTILLDILHEETNKVVAPTIDENEDAPKDRDEKRDNDSNKEASRRALEEFKQKNDSPVYDVFMGQIKSEIRCGECGHTSTKFDASNTLSVPIRWDGENRTSKPLIDCVKEYSKAEQLSGENAWKCPQCKRDVSASKQLQLTHPPPVLLVHLKRFRSEDDYGRREKITDLVDFPLEGLDLSEVMMSDGEQYWKNGEEPVYDCYAVSNHMGQLNAGHYTAFVKDFENGVWNLFDDEFVKQNIPESNVVSDSAYHIFYKRRDAVWSPPIPVGTLDQNEVSDINNHAV